VTRALQISVAGGGAGVEEGDLDAAEEVGRLLAEAGVTVVCGGRGGVMEAVGRGAKGAGGEVVAILPGESIDDANDFCTRAIATGTGHARNLAVAASGDAMIAIAGEWGTLSEIALARRLDRPVVTLGSWEVTGAGEMERSPGVESADTPAAAVEAALRHLRG
jgi:uncharacterized protein (TIGR00725 family)